MDYGPEIESLRVNNQELQKRVRYLEKLLDTRATPLWRRILFRIDGWPSWTVVVNKPQWRPWRKWWTS